MSDYRPETVSVIIVDIKGIISFRREREGETMTDRHQHIDNC